MFSQSGKTGPILLTLALAAGMVLLFVPGVSEAKHQSAWVFDPSSARSYERLGDVQVELLPSRILAVRVMAAAVARLPCAADVVEIESGTSRRGLQPLSSALARTIASQAPAARCDLWREGNDLVALPRDVHPVAVLYFKERWQDAGIDLSEIRSWPAWLAACERYEQYWSAQGTRSAAVELPRGNAAIVMLLLQAKGSHLEAGLLQPAVVETIAEYAAAVRRPTANGLKGSDSFGVGREPFRRVEQSALAMLTGDLGAMIAPDWRVGQIRQLIPGLSARLGLIPFPAEGKTPTWGGTGAGVPIWNSPSPGMQILSRLLADRQGQKLRYTRDGVVPVTVAQNPDLVESSTVDDYFNGQATGQLWLKLAQNIGPVPVSGEATAAIQRELNAAVRAGVAAARTSSGQSDDFIKRVVREQLQAGQRRVDLAVAPTRQRSDGSPP